MHVEPIIIPLSGTVVNWNVYLREVKRLTGDAPCVCVDSSTIKLSDLAKFTASLAEFKNKENTDAAGTLARPGSWLRHTFYSFLVSTSESVVLHVAEVTDLDVLSTKTEDGRVMIVSGNLQVWKDAVSVCLNKDSPKRVRELFIIFRSLFAKLGFDLLWSDYRKKTMPDQTYYLEYKPK